MKSQLLDPDSMIHRIQTMKDQETEKIVLQKAFQLNPFPIRSIHPMPTEALGNQSQPSNRGTHCVSEYDSKAKKKSENLLIDLIKA